jgi:hypothetical protein
MSAIVLVDTSVLMNVLDVPGFNQQRAATLSEFEELVNANAHLFIPMAAVFEAGNHIAQLPQGQVRRSIAEVFVRAIQAALNDEAPWKPMRFPSSSAFALWLNDFPDAAMRGLGMGDLSIQKEWQEQCALYPMSRVRVWTLDGDLEGLDRAAH